MSSSTVPPFNDPGLKAALRRAVGRESAPAGLRDRILAALDEQAIQSTPAEPAEDEDRPAMRLVGEFDPSHQQRREKFRDRGSILRLFRSPAVGLALAACLVIVITVLTKSPFGGERKSVLAQLPRELALAMAQSHDEVAASARKGEATLDGKGRTDASSELSTKLGYRAIAPEIEGWTARAASVRKVNGVDVAQVTYTRGEQAISLYSMPANKAYSPEDGASYDQLIEKHPIAGFVRKQTIYCVVGDANMPMDELKSLATGVAKQPD